VSPSACVAVVRKFGDFISPISVSESTAVQLQSFRNELQSPAELLSFGLFERYFRTVLKKSRRLKSA
jgi:hypothetical protein